MYTEAQKKSQLKYMAEKRDRINLNLPKGKSSEWKNQAKEKGFETLTSYLTYLIEKDRAD